MTKKPAFVASKLPGKRVRSMVKLSGLELVTQALYNVGNMQGGRTQTFCMSLAKEIGRLHAAQEREARQEDIRKWRANEEAKRHGAEPPYPDNDIPF